MMAENTLVLIKPDGVQRKLAGSVITSIESQGLSIKDLQLRTISEDEAVSLYSEHKGKWHFNRNIQHITSGPAIIIRVEGKDAINRCRQIVESFREAHKDVIKLPKNLVHATSSSKRVSEELESVGLLSAFAA